MIVLCEMCSNEFSGLRVEWRRGFTAVCCVACACELARLLRDGQVRFDAKAAKHVASILIRSRQKRPSWDEVSQRLLEERQPLWEALATV